MEAPKLNENWHVRYGLVNHTNILVKVIEDKIDFNPPNWRENTFKCEKLGETIFVHGGQFIECFD